MSEAEPQWECQDCHEITSESELLTAPHPFDPEDVVRGCPSCKGMEFRAGRSEL